MTHSWILIHALYLVHSVFHVASTSCLTRQDQWSLRAKPPKCSAWQNKYACSLVHVYIYSRVETKGQRKSWLVRQCIMQTSWHFCKGANISLSPQWVIISICHLKKLLRSGLVAFFFLNPEGWFIYMWRNKHTHSKIQTFREIFSSTHLHQLAAAFSVL